MQSVARGNLGCIGIGAFYTRLRWRVRFFSSSFSEQCILSKVYYERNSINCCEECNERCDNKVSSILWEAICQDDLSRSGARNAIHRATSEDGGPQRVPPEHWWSDLTVRNVATATGVNSKEKRKRIAFVGQSSVVYTKRAIARMVS
jgi:hypothetical protein